MLRLIIILPTIVLSSALAARTIVVGKNQPVTSIRKAIELAKEKDTILVQPGIYKEGNIILNKNIILLGQNYPVLDGEKKFEILTVSGVNITIKGFQLQNCGQSAMNDYASIKVIDAKNVLIEGNRLINSFFGIHFSNSSFVTIRHNSISGSPTSEQNTGNGIHLWKCNHALIDNNYITGHRDGIYFEFVTESTIQNNLSEKNIRYGLHFMFSNSDDYLNNTFNNNGAGVAVMYSHKVRMEGNKFEMNWGPASYGILLKDITDSYIHNNTFYKNSVGIHMEGSSRINAFKNIFKENGWAIKVQASCDDNNFYQNNFYGNSFDIATNGTMMLNKFYNNYWDKYEGYDRNKDGVGDVPYHPVSMYSMIVEQNPNSLILLRSFMVSLLDKAEKAIPSLTPENLIDDKPMIKPNKL
ncbi:MAG TPA: nitrous oxide reductase family maturation protein NosD [Chitinophagaceae bacterium]|nr:nitrous oxide reductase family maturation protein NosD [Chitinophagaceae bacterium]